ncbi:unnamed protein product [Somion occarium]|uniref:Nitronate monooxygenase domain-containing protein n=1 Tax=Somion occarium TaxID=3059160 RepID=A0ABP1E6P2_9APHY
MARINTKLTRLLGINIPVVCPPMANASGAILPAEVTLGGGFGFIAAGYSSAKALRHEISMARSILRVEASSTLPIGVGYLAWKLEEPGNPAPDMLNAALENGVQAIWLAFGREIGKWVKYIRQYDGTSGRKTIVFIQVNCLEEAQAAYKDWGADVLVAQGIESGGHGGSYAPPLLDLITSITKNIPKDGPPILAAGGLSNGSQVAAFLTLGAAGAVLGTRFLLTPESQYSETQKAALLPASASSTVRTLAFDYARGTLGWPEGINGRGLRNQIVKLFEKGVDIEILREKLEEGTRHGDPDYMITWAGQGVGDMTEIKGAQALVREIQQEIVRCLKAAPLMVEETQTSRLRVAAETRVGE